MGRQNQSPKTGNEGPQAAAVAKLELLSLSVVSLSGASLPVLELGML